MNIIDKFKNLKNKNKVLLIAFIIIIVVVVSVTVKDTHAFYNSETTPIQIFKAKIGNFKPIINSFYIKENNIQPKYTNQNINTVYLSWGNNNKNINEMCITEGDINSCRWQAISNNTQYTFANDTEGEKTIKGYIRDKAGNKSIEKSDTIIYDKTVPTIESATAEDITQTGFTINITANDNKEGVSKTSGIDKYCYGTEDSLLEEKYTCVENSKIAIDNLEAEHSYTYYIYVKDKAGNGSPTNKQSFIFKTEEDKPKPPLEKLTEKGGDTFKEQSGMYRFVGTKDQVTNNYICFGTTDKTECLNTPETYMYRIIGITSTKDDTLGIPANSLKIIKATPSSKSQVWHSNKTSDVKWDDSDMKTYLNETFLDDAVDNKWKSGEYWKGLITSQKWYNADQKTKPTATAEPTTSQTDESKIGLMYGTDYMNANGASTSNWLFITNGWTSNTAVAEWTLSRYGYNGSNYYAWYVNTSGYLGNNYLTFTYAVRPVFYLQSEVNLTGQGTVSDPFRITT